MQQRGFYPPGWGILAMGKALYRAGIVTDTTNPGTSDGPPYSYSQR